MRIFSLIERILLSVILLLHTNAAAADSIKLYIDADYSISSDAALAIEAGVRAALSEVDYRAGGQEVEVASFDHRGNARRSKQTMERYLEDGALALIGGMHSPPYLTHRDFINENKILTLLPWSAAGSITRPEANDENWIFRLSIDDWKSSEFFWRLTKDQGGCAQVGLLLTDTGWGRDGFIRLSEVFQRNGSQAVHFGFFTTPLTDTEVDRLMLDLERSGADCAILMAAPIDGAKIIDATAAHLPAVRLFSHWGILGGDLLDAIDSSRLSSIDLQVLNTCSLEREAEGSVVITRAMQSAGLNHLSLGQVPGSPGFAHAYDLTRILVAAINQAAEGEDWSDDPIVRRAAVRNSLENLEGSIEGIVSDYEQPFSAWSASDLDAHEALGIDDLCASRFASDGSLVDY